MTPRASTGVLCAAVCAAFALASPPIGARPATTDATSLATELRPIDQGLLDAIAAGDRAAWARVIGPGFLYVAEDEQVIDGARLLSLLVPPHVRSPADDWRPFRIRDYQVVVQGDTALVLHHDEETGTHLGSPLHGVDVTTETWRRIGGAWRLLLVHTTPIPTLPPAATLRASDLDALAGTYRADGQTITIRRQGDGLVSRADGDTPVALSPEARDVFFNTNPRQRTIFHRDSTGTVTEMLIRNENRAIVYTRIR